MLTAGVRLCCQHYNDLSEHWRDLWRVDGTSFEGSGEPPTAQQPSVPLPQFEMPQLGFSGQLETAMQAMSTAMGAAIQAQMMAFMNGVLATQRGATATPSISAAAMNVPSPASAAMPSAPSPQVRQGPNTPQTTAGRDNVRVSTAH
jgi:hypothetical protein